MVPSGQELLATANDEKELLLSLSSSLKIAAAAFTQSFVSLLRDTENFAAMRAKKRTFQGNFCLDWITRSVYLSISIERV